MDRNELIKKYNVPVPRYTSYPTVPMWQFHETLHHTWPHLVRKTFEESNSSKGISLYVHLPYCESLCTYCGCTQHITKNHTVERSYIDAVLSEWSAYLRLFSEPPHIREIHLGGGTPTFFSPESLSRLMEGLLEQAGNRFYREFSFEGHPNNTTAHHLQALYEKGFRRVSFGVQDFDLKVQTTINRIQPYENVVRVTEQARQIGYHSINFDLVYGLPFQTIAVIRNTFAKVLALRPERIAFYSYAHVPWKRPGQRRYTKLDLPEDAYKRQLYETGRQMLLEEGYSEIGMDHFALEGDELLKAHKAGVLHRNFMGYTVTNTELLIGLGMSAISDAKYAFAQNVKTVKAYQQALADGASLLCNGHVCTERDMEIRRIIRDIICQHATVWGPFDLPSIGQDKLDKLAQMEREGLVQLHENGLRITTAGYAFVRNICQLFDDRHWQAITDGPRYSKSI
jgi:oxygen-independent coproporphyrinogen-3 oxidase